VSSLAAHPGLRISCPGAITVPSLITHQRPWRRQRGGGPQLWVWGGALPGAPAGGAAELACWRLLQGLDTEQRAGSSRKLPGETSSRALWQTWKTTVLLFANTSFITKTGLEIETGMGWVSLLMCLHWVRRTPAGKGSR